MSTEPDPQTVTPAPLSTEPGPQTVTPAPLSAEPGPRTVIPAPLSAEPGPRTVTPAPLTGEADRRTVTPAPLTAEPGPQTVTPAPLTGAAPAELRDAATVILLREVRGAPQLLLLRRHARSGFAARAWVFPGGVADPADRLLPAGHRTGARPEALAALTGRDPQVALGLAVAAVRETFEEAGLLLAQHRDGTPVDLTDPEVVALRRALGDRDAEADFTAWVLAEDLVLDLGALTPYSRWLTPTAEPRRYDTAFFLARAPEGQVAAHDEMETTDSRWTTAADALAAARRGELALIYPTLRTLEALAPFDDLPSLLAGAPPARLRPLQPHAVTDPDGRVTAILHPDDPAYPWERYPELRVP